MARSRFRVLSTFAAAALLAAASSRGDDRQLLIEKKPAPPNVMLIISNTTTMANLPGTTTLDPLGGVDGTNSKMGQGKYAITKVVENIAAGCAAGTGGCINWGLSSFSYTRADLAGGTKHFVFEPNADVALTYSGFTFTIPAHTKFNFGGGTFPSSQKKTYSGNSYSVLAWSGTNLTNGTGTITDPSLTTRTYFYPSAPQTTSDTAHLPFGGSDGTKKILITGVPSSSNSSGDPAAEMTIAITGTNPSGIMPYSILQSGQSFTVTFTIGRCTGGGNPTAPCDPASLGSAQSYNATFVVPPEYCSETTSTCAFPQIFGYGVDVGREIGWVSVPKVDNNQTVLDWNGNNSSGNASGWMQQSNVNPQPIVLIPHDYQPWLPYISGPKGKPSSASQTYIQSPNPCILRALRPTASVVHIGSPSATYTESDDYPVWDITKTPDHNYSKLPNTIACDLESDGYYQTGVHIIGNPDSSTNTSNFVYQNSSNNRMIAPIFPTQNGNVAPLQGVMTNVFQYFNGANKPNVSGTGCATNSMVDNFCGAKRIDDPRKDCRNAAVILITDSYQAQSAVTQADVSPLAAINVPVYVVGFGINSGDLGPTNVCTIPDGNGGTTGGNRGQCIALWSGATIVSSDGVTIERQGYYTASSASDLIAALTSIANLLNEETRDFATATIPSVSATSEGLAYLSEFNPQNEHSIWSGHLRAFALDPTSGLVQSTGGGYPLLTAYHFGSGAIAPSGSLVWDAGNTGQDTRPTTNDIGVIGRLDRNKFIDPTQTLTHGAQWSDTTNDQAVTTPKFGRNLFFGLRAGEGGCNSATYECLVQIPSGTTGPSKTCTLPMTGCQSNYPPTADSSPSWWSIVRDNSNPATQTIYANIPNPLVYPSGTSPAGTEASAGLPTSDAARNQALQNSFSFIRGNRDVVVEDLHISSTFGNPQTKSCTQLNGFSSSPCYYDQILGDVFHSNPVIVSFPSNTRLFLSVDPGASSPGVYGDRNDSYQTFFANYRHRRKVLFAGADDGFLHAFDVGVYNGDTSTYTQGTITVCPLCNKYDLGSGREIFGYAPRASVRKFFYLAHATSHDWTIDGAPSVDDIYMDVARVGGNPQGIVSSDACGNPCANISGTTPAWRTVLIGTEREGGVNTTPNGGGGSVFALDITDPDEAAHMKNTWTGVATGQTPTRGVPECLVTGTPNPFDPSSGSPNTGCNAPYPRILWEFRDDQATSANPGTPTEGGAESSVWDLGYTWSKPVIGRIKVNDVASGNHHDMFVAIFGAGFRHNTTTIAGTNTSGDTANYLYMLDIETGKILYKRNIGVWSSGASSTDTTGNLEAGVPGEAAVVDVNFDGYLDRIYFGDTQGRLWKIDMTSPADLCSAAGTNCTSADYRIASTQWSPSLLFDEFQDAVPPTGTGVRQPIFTRPAVFLLGTTGSGQPRLGIAFGTGDRDNMPALRDSNPNYFFVVLDDPSATYPVFKTPSSGSTASTLTQASLTSNACDPTVVPNGCFNGTGVGYYLSLPVDTVYGGDQIAEIMNANPLVFSGAIFFNTFLNNTQQITNADGSVTQVGQGVCGEVGQAHLYEVNYLTGVSLYTDANGNIVPSEAPSGGQVASDPIVYQAPNGETIVVSATDDLKVPKVGGGGLANVNIKSWKEN
ncbi:MAG TPA: PilC/PilY family type IV pilus protein [Thermoanaerobaculia bacterium]|nr:PilC/PilY family type IV pilus protein [Thermoanaerobaculia bacterium]